MPIVMPCAQCGEKYELSDTLAGKKVRCKVCRAVFRVPVPSRPPSSVITTRPTRPPHAKPPQPEPKPDPNVLFDLPSDGPDLDSAELALRRAAGFEHLADEA
jgi:DNA-directed RNA polymerase subunit RPC12/RpoP